MPYVPMPHCVNRPVNLVSGAGCAGWVINAHLLAYCSPDGGSETTVIRPLPGFNCNVPVDCVLPGGDPIVSSLKLASNIVVELHETSNSVQQVMMHKAMIIQAGLVV